MNLLEASGLINDEHVQAAAIWVDEHGVDRLFERTGRRTPRYRYIVVNGRRYPTKAFGFLVAQIAGGSDRNTNDMNVNQAAAPLIRLGYVEVSGPDDVEETPDQADARKVSYYQSLARPGQAAFRQVVLATYDNRCAVTGCAALNALEAAHVQPFWAGGADEASNGILFRADLHRLFDAGQIAVHPETLKLHVSKQIKGHYAPLHGHRITLPTAGPKASQLKQRWKDFTKAD